MRTYSTPQSALDGEITRLAIIECVASAAFYVGLGVYLGTFKYLAWAVVVAPLMLFRTEFSADWGLELYDKASDRLLDWGIDTDTGTSRDSLLPLHHVSWLLRLLLAMLALPLLATGIRIVSTVYWTARRPLQTLRDTPRNWLRQGFCTDFAHPPEMIPKEATAKGSGLRFMEILDAIRAREGSERAWFIILFSPLFILGWLPSVIYRVSFKATALAYAPFVWVAHATLRNPLPVKARLERITKGELEKVRRGLSWIILTTIVAKLALVLSWVDRSYVESKFPSQKIVTNFVILDGWPWWQITLLADALLTFFLLFFADAALARIEGQQPWREESVMATVAATSFLRGAFGLVTISHFFYVALIAAAPEAVRHLLLF